MRFITSLLSTLAIASGAQCAQAVSAHGERDVMSGKNIRWQQLAEGVYTGVPDEEWDDSIHKRYNIELDVDELLQRRGLVDYSPNMHTGRDLALESRNLKDQCQAITNCVKVTGQWTIAAGIASWITIADYAKPAGKSLMAFLNQPFWANTAGIAVAGTISGQINQNTAPDCSTSSSEADLIGAVVSAAVASKPDSGAVEVDVNGPTGSWFITVKAGPEGSNPGATC